MRYYLPLLMILSGCAPHYIPVSGNASDAKERSDYLTCGHIANSEYFSGKDNSLSDGNTAAIVAGGVFGGIIGSTAVGLAINSDSNRAISTNTMTLDDVTKQTNDCMEKLGYKITDKD